MTFKFPCVPRKWKRTACIFVAAVILIVLAHNMYRNYYDGKNNIIKALNRGPFSLLPPNTYRYNVIPNSINDYQGNDYISAFKGKNRLQFQPFNPRNISKSSSSKKTTKYRRTDTFVQKQNLSRSYVPAREKEEGEDSATTKIRLTTPMPIISNETSTYNLYDYKTKTITENVLNKISNDLIFIMDERLPPKEMKIPETCSEETLGNSCNNSGCLQLQLPKNPQIRLEQLVRPENLHPDAKYVNVMLEMGNAIPGFYDIILITAASSNHYLESKYLLYNLHANLLPHLRNFTIIYYDLGLTVEQKEAISRMCQCHMLDFPFDKFPEFVSSLKCYTWKPIIINAHAPHCNVIHWMDSSIRYFHDFSTLRELLRRARVHGIVDLASSVRYIPHVTLREMFHFFGDEACVYLPYKDAGGGFIMFLNEPLIKWGILEPWTACALNESCMCVKHPSVALHGCMNRKGPHEYGLCHRYDQSALGIIVNKLFREKSDHFFIHNYLDFFGIKVLNH